MHQDLLAMLRVRLCASSILVAALLLLLLTIGCAPTPKMISDSPRVNAGVNIVPDAVLASQKIPPSTQPSSNDLPDLIDVINDSDEKHYKLIELLRDSGLVPVLQQKGPYTVFAPTDEAFSKLPPGVFDRLVQPAQHSQLVTFVKYHLIAGLISNSDMLQTNGQITTLCGQNVVIKGIDSKAMVNDANVLRSDTAASNGVVHWIDSVLLPS